MECRGKFRTVAPVEFPESHGADGQRLSLFEKRIHLRITTFDFMAISSGWWFGK